MSDRRYLGELELIVMSAVMRLADEAYGVPICREIKQCCGREVSYGSVYAALNRLEEKGHLVSQLAEPLPVRGGRAKRFFRTTPKGLQHVQRSQQAFVKLWRGVPKLKGASI